MRCRAARASSGSLTIQRGSGLHTRGQSTHPPYFVCLQLSRSIGPETCDLMDKLLTCNPRERVTASAALDHEYFWTDPLPADPKRCVVDLAVFTQGDVFFC